MYNPPIEEFYFLKIKNMWRYFKGQHFSFWMICFYLFFEYTRPQSIFPVIDFLPWAQLFLIGALIGAFLDPSVKWVSSPLNFLLIWFAIAIFISSITAVYPDISKKYYIDFYSWFVIYFLIISIVNTKQRFYVFLVIFILCAAKISIGVAKIWIFRGFAFTTWGLTGPPGYFQNSGELSILMLTFFPVVYFLYAYLKCKLGRIERGLLLIFWITPILTILGASSRGAQVALAIQLLIIFRKKVFKLKSFLGLIILLTATYYLLPDEQKARFESAGDDKTSQQRLLYWEHGLDMIKEHPLLGVGYFNFPQYYADYYSNDMLYATAQLPHNIFIQVGTDAGFTGLTPYIIMLLIAMLIPLQVNKLHTEPIIKVAISGITIGLLGFVIAGQFVSVVYYPFMWIGLAFLVTLKNISQYEEKECQT